MRDGCGRTIDYLRLSVTDLCNLRCRYCMGAEGICSKRSHEEMLTEEEMILAVEAAAGIGIRKVRITGGEPLVKKNIVSICRRTAQVPGIGEVCMTTNGVGLPQLARPLREAGVSRLNISIDTLDEEKYRYITRQGSLRDALAGLEAALGAGFKQIKINAVLIGGFNDTEIPALAELTRRYPVDVRFIELMPMFDNPDFGPGAYVPGSRVLEVLPELVPESHHDGVAAMYRLPDSQGCVGLINPLSNHFCGECNRLRLTADGKLKPCLHSPLEFSVKGMTRQEMEEQMLRAIAAKPERHVPLSCQELSQAGRSMNRIGG